jgi:hypothetical protein
LRHLSSRGDALLFIATTCSCWGSTFATTYYRSTSIERMRAWK